MESFLSICQSLNVSEETSSEWMANINRQYSGENRYFHNVQMLEKKLDLIEEFAGEESFKNALVLSTFFQYYNYDVKRDLKRENCDEFKLFIDQSGIKDESLINDVLAMLQDDEAQPSESSLTQIDLFNDLDLAILGSPPEEYSSYSQQLNKEYATESYHKDRLKMLKTLLMIPNIYSNSKVREKFEETARSNIQREIEELQK